MYHPKLTFLFLTALPLPLPDRFKGSLKCNPAPTGKYPDSHCGMVWFAIREFCDEFAYSFLRDRNNPRSNASVDLYNTPIVGWNGKEGPQRRFPEDDDYHIEIFEVPYCGDPRLLWEYEKYTSDKWCQAMLWGTWTSCKFPCSLSYCRICSCGIGRLLLMWGVQATTREEVVPSLLVA